ncbi:MAG: hypothetical protein IT285_04070 [Bdellovibrionales bacterium]|nr:hypothetical protein [Bdellovibrionales bacterium]
MSNTEAGKKKDESEKVPLGQRLFDRPFLLLIAGIVVIAVFYTGWGLVEIMTLPKATLP